MGLGRVLVYRAWGSLLELIRLDMFILVKPINSRRPGPAQLSSVTETS